jgi:hypothetical protein
VFVGDRGTLVVPLGAVPADFGAKPIAVPVSSGDLVIHRIAFERRGENAHLLIDFTAYRTGLFDVPPIADFPIPSSALRLSIASILTPASMGLAPPAPPLAVPGTTVLIYGTAAGLISGLLVLLGVRLFWFRRFGALRRLFLRKALIRRMRRLTVRLRAERAETALNLLSAELRSFVGRFFAIDCAAISAAEFAALPALTEVSDGAFLADLFRRMDALRFSAAAAPSAEVSSLLDAVARFITTLAERQKPERSTEHRNDL